MYYFDVILVIDWLANCHTSVDCFSKGIIFKITREIKFQFRGNQKNYGG